jgi:prepilin signal peptidase PulO-like enzyme (type II secretory pathway)
MEIFVLSLLGLSFGSFVNAFVWRVHKKRNFVSERSECTHCHHMLAWNDLIPVASWVMLRGKCRYCSKMIDDSPVVELFTPITFVISYLVWPYGFETAGMVLFGLWLAALVLLVALAVYDTRWYLLPDVMVFPLIAVGLAIGLTRFVYVEGLEPGQAILNMALGVVVISGLYFALHEFSSGKWVGFGDVKLGVFIGVILGWQGALLALFLANLIGLIFVLPPLLLKKLQTSSKIPFGPFLIVATFITFLWGQRIIEWYLQSIVGI